MFKIRKEAKTFHAVRSSQAVALWKIIVLLVITVGVAGTLGWTLAQRAEQTQLVQYELGLESEDQTLLRSVSGQ